MPKDPHVPKKKKASKKGASGALKSDGHASDPDTGSDSSDDELTIEEEAPEMTPAVLTVSAPTDERGRAIYDAVSAVWSPRNKSVPAEKIRTGIAGFGDTVRSLRDSWKLKNDNLRKAELPNSPTASEATRLKEEAARYRSAMEIVMARSLTFGHPAVVKRLGENQFTMSALYSFMLDRFNAGDYDSSLVSNIMKFVVKFETLDAEMLEMTKLSKILQRFAKKATNESKTLAQNILDNAAAATAKKRTDASLGKVSSPGTVDSPGTAARREGVTGIKRAREGETAPQPATKKVARVASKPLAVQNAERRRALESSQAAKDGGKATGSATVASTGAASKGKVAVAAPPKSAVFSSLVSASKKPGTSLAARAAAAVKDKVSSAPSTTSTSQVKDTAKRDSPPHSANITVPLTKAGASSFLGLLADIEKKPEKAVKKDNDTLHETEEQKAKRLRKEARRKLRVSWKADADLVETRLFTHDPSEEIGHNDSQMRDAGDTGREGEMLKLHKGMEDIDEDEEDDDSFDDLEPFIPPTEVDFSVLPDDDPEVSPSTINGFKFGGAMKPESATCESQNKHELETVMAIYATKADRPSTPKEPDDDEGEFEPAEPETPFGEPNEKVRAREEEHLNRQARLRPSNGIYPSKKDLALQIQAGEIPTELQRALKMFGQQSQPTQPTPPPPAPTSGVSLPNEALLLASVQQIRQQLTGQAPQTQYQPPVQNTSALANIDLAALLASMKQQSQLQAQQPVIPLGLGGNSSPFVAASDDPSRKHSRTDSNELEEPGRKGGNKKKKAGFVADQSRPYNYKTQVCSFWQQGKCLKGDSCTYLHGDE
ncbi:uncharacterized protein A1O9_00860 [Exophiala aquamarina CBS 119918]|uniref:C3H1-type domain-containing protein n=1 Tax=Exophiala aquamarina CBS 119918 TaxID=1182545 RepID=A0A072PSP0_9EURO|nr:uncharacterized protein A1O9_00860 [Exophiala aquamarina CBS 119918]KEF62886.1 hypothetical protein A1O9_00860 [Exophiala aquamarina CBS 119918]